MYPANSKSQTFECLALMGGVSGWCQNRDLYPGIASRQWSSILPPSVLIIVRLSRWSEHLYGLAAYNWSTRWTPP